MYVCMYVCMYIITHRIPLYTPDIPIFFLNSQVVYNFCYYFCGCCASSVQLTDPNTELALYQAVGRR